MKIIFTILLLFFSTSSQYAVNNIFNRWNCIGIKNKIDFSVPHKVNVGDLSLILWKNESEYYVSSNICKHLGYNLENGYIKNNCLICPNHKSNYTYKDSIGKVIESENKLFWSYKNESKIVKMPLYNKEKFKKLYMEIEMDCNLEDSIYYLMDFKNSHLKFLNNYYINDGKKFYYKDKSIGSLLECNLNKKFISLYYKFIYPNNFLQKFNIDNKKNLIISTDLLPISDIKTKWFLTILYDNFDSNYIKEIITKNLKKDKSELSKLDNTNSLKDELILKKNINNEDHLLKIQEMYKNYIYPTIYSSIILYKDYHKIYYY